jgi:DNA polymerase I-like protein with 3'-5' exonuclease and polymerase domains
MLASQVLLCGVIDFHNLKACVLRFLGKEIDKDHGSDDWGVSILSEAQLKYAAQDVEVLRELYIDLMERLERQSLTSTFELECQFLYPLVSMSALGVRIDVDHWRKRSIEARQKAEEIEEELQKELPPLDPEPLREVRKTKKGEDSLIDLKWNARVTKENAERKWNLGSPKQLLQAFKLRGLELPDTSYETLIEMRLEDELLDKLVEHRLWAKQGEAFGEDWLKNLAPGTHHVFPWWKQMGTRSGRMSCANPNLQQTPRGACRKGIIAEEGCLLVRADYSQIEARVAAKVSGEPTLSRLFIENKVDIHRFTASRVLEKNELDVTKEERQIGKSLLFGLLFGMQVQNLRIYCRTTYGVQMSLEEAEIFREKFFEVFPGLAEWHAETRKKSKFKLDFRTMTGRRRWVPEDVNANRQGIGLNHPVQGTAADLLKIASIALWERRAEFPEFRLTALIHDEIIGNVPIGLEKQAGDWLRSVMIEVGNKLIDPIPVDAEVKIGRSWGG